LAMAKIGDFDFIGNGKNVIKMEMKRSNIRLQPIFACQLLGFAKHLYTYDHLDGWAQNRK
jgi:hypothetical protein